MKIDAGKLDRRATLLKPENSRNSVGEVTVSYADAGKRWASFLALMPSEVDREQSPGSRADTKLLMRLDTVTRGIGVRWRVSVDSVVYNVTGTDPTPGDGSLMLYLAGVQE